MKKKILLTFGTRPEAIKMAPLVKQLKMNPDLDSRVCVTAQHREMLDQVLNTFEIHPEYDLNLMRQGQDLYDLTARVLLGMRDVFMDFQPDLALVHGDTSTSFATALAAFYQKIPIGHVEAGLRTGNITSPWPEEANRQLTTRLAQWHFAPTQCNMNSLIAEGIAQKNIIVTGNTVIDALLITVEKIRTSNTLRASIIKKLVDAGLHDTTILQKAFVLITGHRRENFGTGFENICIAIQQLAKNNPAVHFIYPVHLNPNVQEPVNRLLSGLSNVDLIRPLEYQPFVFLMSKSQILLTDSGGVQEEAPSLGKPVLVMRDTTERPEALKAGTVTLVGTDTNLIIKSVQRLLSDIPLRENMSKISNPYGDGKASERIVHFLTKLFP